MIPPEVGAPNGQKPHPNSVLSHVTIYTDGACEGNPGPGGWAALLVHGTKKKTLHGGEGYTTNNRMELTAALEALKALIQPCQVDLYTDSEYLKRGITEWLPGWKARGWKRREGALANVDLWQALDAILTRHTVAWHWLRGHAGQRDNELVDQLARQSARQAAEKR
jgi:ribonuclease HI